MQNTSTGDLVPLHLKDLVEVLPTKEFIPFEHLEKLEGLKEKIQAAKDEAIPIREHQGPVFTVGEILTIKGGKFRVQAITEKRLYLDSLPAD